MGDRSAEARAPEAVVANALREVAEDFAQNFVDKYPANAMRQVDANTIFNVLHRIANKLDPHGAGPLDSHGDGPLIRLIPSDRSA